jgi:hypothetical protein
MSKSLTVTNNETSSVTFYLIGDGGLANLVSSNQTTIPPGGSVAIPYVIDFTKSATTPSGSVTGNVRPYGFNQGDALTLNIVNAYQFQVSPTTISCSQGQTCTGYVTIQNTGTNTITGLSAPTPKIIPSSPGGTQPNIVITPTGGSTIQPGGSASYYYSIQVPSGGVAGGYVDFVGNCFKTKVLIQTQ